MTRESEASDILANIYKDVNEWLKFGEAKNAALLTFNGIVFFTLLRITLTSSAQLKEISQILYLCLFLLSLNIVILLISFLPSLKQNRKSLKNMPKDFNFNENYLFYGNIRNQSVQSLLKAIKGKYKISTNERDLYLVDQCLQVISISKIAWRKYRFFIVCCYVDIIIFLVLIFRVIIWFLFER